MSVKKKAAVKTYLNVLGGGSWERFTAEDDLAALRMMPYPWQLYEVTGELSGKLIPDAELEALVKGGTLRQVLDRHLLAPPHLDDVGRRAHEALLVLLVRHGLTYTGGCKAFWSPREWDKHGEPYGRGAKLIVMYDGGEVRQLMDGAHDSALVAALRPLGLFAERCTHYYSAIYLIDSSEDALRCNFADCAEGHPLAPEDAAPTDITCPTCLANMAQAGEA